jgi:hypothetical protein
MPVVLYGYKTWSLTVTEVYALNVLENKVLRKIFGPWGGGGGKQEGGGDGITMGFKVSYCPPAILRVITSRRIRARYVAQRTGACRDLVRKSEGQTPLGRPRRRWQDNVSMDL